MAERPGGRNIGVAGWVTYSVQRRGLSRAMRGQQLTRSLQATDYGWYTYVAYHGLLRVSAIGDILWAMTPGGSF